MIQKEHMTDKTNKRIYDAIDYSFIKASLLHPTYNNRYKKDSKNSYIISRTKKENQPETSNDDEKHCLLLDVFDIGTNDREAFKKAFDMAVHGDGQEGKRITVMHSSSLCALLCFYKVSKKNPISINGIKYDEVYFEVQNEVFKAPSNPSNIDVVLISHEQKKILFLESKFSEYLSHGKCTGISQKYKETYDSLDLGTLYEYPKDNNNELELSKAKPGKNDFYIEGIKQMISHYMGVKSFCRNKESTNNKDVKLFHGYEVLLGEILFDAWSKSDESFCRYKKAYNELAVKINENDNSKGFNVLNDILTYQTVFKGFPLDERVKKYYKL